MNRPLAPLSLAAALALAAPPLLAYTLTPSSTLLNQLLAIGAWGAALVMLEARWRAGSLRAVGVPLAALGLLMAGVWVSAAQMLPESMALSAGLTLACAAIVLVAAQADDGTEGGTGEGPLLWPALSGALLAAVLSSVVALVQVFAPSWPDGSWIARSGLVGRAVGNLRQPNHLSTVLLWGLIALVPLAQRGRWLGLRLTGRRVAALGSVLVLSVVLTASRTGLVGMLLLGLWGAVDKRLPRGLRIALLTAPLVYAAWWLVMAGWAHETAHTFGGEARLAEGDVSASRFGIWANTLHLIAAHPWTGVGFGQFNFAWTLTPFPGRPVAFFDHTHNLLLQFAVELGLPAALLLTGLLLWALAQALRRNGSAAGLPAAGARAALVMVLLAGLHSFFEYPLWYAHFLLPTAWALGQALRWPAGGTRSSTNPAPARPNPQPPARPWATWLLPSAGALMMAGALLAAWDYHRVVLIYAPGSSTLSLQQRIADGQASWLYGHHADYAAATTTEPPSMAMGAFASTTHSLLDTRLMIAWAKALNESGHRDKASYLAARLREFRNPASDEFFAVCDDSRAPPPAHTPAPFQCVAPTQPLTWRDFGP